MGILQDPDMNKAHYTFNENSLPELEGEYDSYIFVIESGSVSVYMKSNVSKKAYEKQFENEDKTGREFIECDSDHHEDVLSHMQEAYTLALRQIKGGSDDE